VELGRGIASPYFASADDQSGNIETSQPCFPMGRQSKRNRIRIATRMVGVALAGKSGRLCRNGKMI
jgi:hypothetical protein